MSDLREKDTEKKTKGVLDTAGEAAPHPLSNTCRKPGGSQGGGSQARPLGPEGQHLCHSRTPLCSLPHPQPPGIQFRGPQHPMEVEAAWVEQGGGGQGSGQDHCLEKEELTSAPAAGPPAPPRFLLPGRPQTTLSTLFGDGGASWHVRQSRRGATALRGGGYLSSRSP